MTISYKCFLSREENKSGWVGRLPDRLGGLLPLAAEGTQ